jgi:hypothetical protein
VIGRQTQNIPASIMYSYTVDWYRLEFVEMWNRSDHICVLWYLIYCWTGENVSSSCTGLKSLYLNGGGHWWHLRVEKSEPLTFS